MEKKNRRRIYHRSIIRTLTAMLAVILMLNTAVAVYAKEAMIPQISGYPLPLSDGAEKKLSDDTTEVRAEGGTEQTQQETENKELRTWRAGERLEPGQVGSYRLGVEL